MIDGLIIRTEQTIPSLKFQLPEGADDEKLKKIEQQIVYLFERVYRPMGIELRPHPDEYLNFSIRTLNYDGVSKTEELKDAYEHFSTICHILNLKVS